jgi:hypothetical protein
MQVLPFRSAAIRMAILIFTVVAIDIAAALLIAKPARWCAAIPGLIPLLTPLAIFSLRADANRSASEPPEASPSCRWKR